MPVTMSDIAERSGFSVCTVSRVVNNCAAIAPDTRRSVLAVIKELGYRPSRLARGLVTQRTDAVGLLIPAMLNAHCAEPARAVINRAEEPDCPVVVSHLEEGSGREMRALEVFADYAVGGLCFTRFDHGSGR